MLNNQQLCDCLADCLLAICGKLLCCLRSLFGALFIGFFFTYPPSPDDLLRAEFTVGKSLPIRCISSYQ